MDASETESSDSLMGIAAEWEQELLRTIPDPEQPSVSEVRQIDLWRRLVLLAERLDARNSTDRAGAQSTSRLFSRHPSISRGSPRSTPEPSGLYQAGLRGGFDER